MLPKLEGSCFRFGEDPIDQEFVIYVRLDRLQDAWNPYHKSGSNIAISMSLKFQEGEFFKRHIPLDSNANLDVKISVRSNEKDFTEFLNHLSSKIQVLVADGEQPEELDPVLESDDIFFGTLVHTEASLSLYKISEVEGFPSSARYFNCYVFLERRPKRTEEIDLTNAFREVKRSSGIPADYSRPEIAVKQEDIDPVGTADLKNGEKRIEPMDLSIKTPRDVSTQTIKTTPKNHLSVPVQDFKQKSGYVGSPTCQRSAKKRPFKAEPNLSKLKRAKAIQWKRHYHGRFQRLLQKIRELERRLLALEKQKRHLGNQLGHGSSNKSDVSAENQVTDNGAEKQQCAQSSSNVTWSLKVLVIPYDF